jgi:hypothetical protein
MQDEKWENLLDNLEIKFGKLERKRSKSTSEDDVGHEITAIDEWVEFDSPIGKMKLVRTTRPMIIDKKFHYTHTGGSKGKVEYVLSDTEKSHKVTLYRWNDIKNDWLEVEQPKGELKF